MTATSTKRSVTSRQAALALFVGVIADLIQLPINLGYLSVAGAVPAEAADLLVDTVTALIVTRLLGFHWALLPTFAVEMVPLLDAAPTWTGCVLYVISRRKAEGRYVAGTTTHDA